MIFIGRCTLEITKYLFICIHYQVQSLKKLLRNNYRA